MKVFTSSQQPEGNEGNEWENLAMSDRSAAACCEKQLQGYFVVWVFECSIEPDTDTCFGICPLLAWKPF